MAKAFVANNQYRKSKNSRGFLDALVVTGEELASYLSRRDKPPKVTLDRIMNLVEKAQTYQHVYKSNNGKEYPVTAPSKVAEQERQREKCITRLWELFREVQESEIMHSSKKGKDESWNNAKKTNGHWVSEPLYFYGDHLEHVLADEMHGYKAQGRTKVKSLDSYDGNEGYGGDE
tara:strand:- start:59 stop:583 length:525 start_codon:yes stop_codon:yes gene_type:complete